MRSIYMQSSKAHSADISRIVDQPLCVGAEPTRPHCSDADPPLAAAAARCAGLWGRYYERVVELEAALSEARMLLERERLKATNLAKELRRVTEMYRRAPSPRLERSRAVPALVAAKGKNKIDRPGVCAPDCCTRVTVLCTAGTRQRLPSTSRRC